MITGFVFVAILLLISLIGWSFRKVDNKVDEYKLNRNPHDVNSLEKLLMKTIVENKSNDELNICRRILSVDNNNIFALSYEAAYYHENKDYSNSEPILKKLVLHLFNDKSLNKLIWKFTSLSSDVSKDIIHHLIGKTYYYYGHICSINGKDDEANKWKNKGKLYNRKIIKQNLY